MSFWVEWVSVGQRPSQLLWLLRWAAPPVGLDARPRGEERKTKGGSEGLITIDVADNLGTFIFWSPNPPVGDVQG